MGYPRYQPGDDRQDLYDTRTDDRGRYANRSSAREYAAAAEGSDDDRGYENYGNDRYGYGRYGARDSYRPAGRIDAERNRGTRYAAPRRDPTPRGYDYEERGFFARAGDEMASWFGDEEAERRRWLDQRYDAQNADRGYTGDHEYHGWRQRQIDSLDRDYHEYRREKQQDFEQQFGGWRSERDTQRQALARVEEHMEVLGSDGAHVGTVDKVRGDRIILTKSDPDAGGHHHSVPVRWIQAVGDSVTLTKTADEAQRLWRDEDRSGAMFGRTGQASGLDPATSSGRFGSY